MNNTIYMVYGEVVDTRDGYTHMDIWAEYEDKEWSFYKSYYGVRGEPTFKIDDSEEIKELMEELKKHKDYHE